MAFYPQSILDEIRNRISIASYIGEHIPLKKAGRNFKGICPFHAEKTPSFMVSDEKEIYHCFGCGEGGNIFSFVMKYDGLSFPEAVELLASRAGVTIPKEQLTREENDKINSVTRKKKLLLRVNEITADFFRSTLLNGQKNAAASNYMKLRGISDEISTQHFLGYADDKWDALVAHLKSRNVPLQLAKELGLVKQKDGTGDCYDFFRSRLIFPIISHRNEVLGFGGRVIIESDKEGAKYLNSPDSLIYHKSHSVYGLNVAAKEIRLKDKVIIVEGYMDVLALNQAGIFNVVAPLGTALTEGHVRLLSRYSKNMSLVFDGDSAGIAAAERSLPVFMEAGIMPKVVVLPNGMDPDDWVRAGNGGEFHSLIENSDSLLAWQIKKKAVMCGADISLKAKVISELSPYFENISSSFEFMSYRKMLADELKVDENDLIRQLEYHGKSRTGVVEIKNAAGKLKTEKLLISILLEYPELMPSVSGKIDSSYFSEESFKTIFETLISESVDENFSAGKMLDLLGDDELINSVHTMSLSEDVDSENAADVLEDCLKYLTKSRFAEKLKLITEEIRRAEEKKDENAIYKLITEKNKLLSQSV